MECDCRLLWLRNITQHTFGLLFRREFKHYKCVFTKELANFKVGDDIKILEMVKNEEFVNSCHTNNEIEETLDVQTVSTGHGFVEEKMNQINPNQSTTEMIENKIDSDNKKQMETHSTHTFEEIHSTHSSTEYLDQEIEKQENDVNVEKTREEDISLVKASQERTGSGNGVDSCVHCDIKIIFSLIFTFHVFRRFQFKQ